ncbi:MAG: hypothetical protein AAB906_04220 [Patescibacteria group bacterium]
MTKTLYLIIYFVMLGIGISIGFFGKDFYSNREKIRNENNQLMPISSGPISNCPSIDWTNSPFAGESYFKQYTLRGKIASIKDQGIFLNISNIDVAGQTLNPGEKTERKIVVSNQTEIVEQPKNKMGDPAPINGSNNLSPDGGKKELKNISINDLKIDDIIFIITSQESHENEELEAIKIVKEQSELMKAAPITP